MISIKDRLACRIKTDWNLITGQLSLQFAWNNFTATRIIARASSEVFADLAISYGFARRMAHPRALVSAISTGFPSSTDSMASLRARFVVRDGLSASSI
jgi:hypothetical protein